MSNKKMTKKEMFAQIMTNYNLTQAEADFIQHEIDLLAKKNSGEKKQNAQQVANAGIKEAIWETMESNMLYTISDMSKQFECCADISSQRLTALVHQLVGSGKVVRIEEKRKAYFQKVEGV